MKAELHRAELSRLVRQVPFRRFVVGFDGGERVLVLHPENIAFDPEPGNRADLYIIGGGVRYFGTMEAISAIAMFDEMFNQVTGEANA